MNNKEFAGEIDKKFPLVCYLAQVKKNNFIF